MNNTDRLRKLYAEIRDYAIRMDPSMRDNFTANVRLMAGEALKPQDWVAGARHVVDRIQSRMVVADTGWVTKTARMCYLRQTRKVQFMDGVPSDAVAAFVDYERSMWDGQEFQAAYVGGAWHMSRAVDSGD